MWSKFIDFTEWLTMTFKELLMRAHKYYTLMLTRQGWWKHTKFGVQGPKQEMGFKRWRLALFSTNEHILVSYQISCRPCLLGAWQVFMSPDCTSTGRILLMAKLWTTLWACKGTLGQIGWRKYILQQYGRILSLCWPNKVRGLQLHWKTWTLLLNFLG